MFRRYIFASLWHTCVFWKSCYFPLKELVTSNITTGVLIITSKTLARSLPRSILRLTLQQYIWIKYKYDLKTKKQLRVLKTIRGVYPIYTPSINTTWNPSESHGTVPSEIAKLNPVFKTGDSLIMDNYPPKHYWTFFQNIPIH